MKRVYAWLLKQWIWMWDWANETEPMYTTVTQGSRDRTLSGMARRKARKTVR